MSSAGQRRGLRWAIDFTAALLLTSGLAGSGVAFSADKPLLNIYNWSDYIDPQLIEEFEREYGIRVNYDIYDSSEIVDTKLLTGHSGYDIVIHSASFSQRLIPIGVYQSVDYKRLDNWHHIDPDLLARIRRYFADNIAGVPYMWVPPDLPTTAIWCCSACRMPHWTAPPCCSTRRSYRALPTAASACWTTRPRSFPLRCCTWAIPPILSSPLTWPRWRHY